MSNSTTKPRTQHEFTGWHMLGVMVLFFGVIIAVNLFMAFSAIGTWTGLVVQNSYVASQEFNTKLANARAQQEMGWQGGLEYAPGQLIFTLRDADNKPLQPENVTIAITRPIGTKGEQTVTLQPVENGDFMVAVTLEPGVWNAAIVAEFADQPAYEHHARITAGGGA